MRTLRREQQGSDRSLVVSVLVAENVLRLLERGCRDVFCATALIFWRQWSR